LDSRTDREALLNEKILPLKTLYTKKLKKAQEEFRELLRNTPQISTDSKWGEIRAILESEGHIIREVLSEKDREKLLDEYIKQMKKEQEEVEKRRKLEEEVKKDREREVLLQRDRDEKKIARERERLEREQEVRNFSSLLAEHVHDTSIKWSKVKRKLGHDPRFTTRILKQADKERLFSERLHSLKGKLQSQFGQLLRESLHIDINSQWFEVRPTVQQDVRFNTVDERTREEIFNRFLQDMKSETEKDFINMCLGFEKITKDSPTEGKDYDMIKSMLRGDPRWKRLNPIPELRDHLLKGYITDLRDGKIVRGERGRELQRAERLERERELERIASERSEKQMGNHTHTSHKKREK